MGYRTNYSLNVFDSNFVELAGDLQEIHRNELEAEGEAIFDSEPIKWYDHRRDMCRYSKRYPDLIFRLHGDGDNTEDIWDEYYVDGSFQEAAAVLYYPPYDQTKLVQYLEKKPFKIDVCRTGYGFATITVEATSQQEAERLALEEACNHDFSEKMAEYHI